MKSRARRYFKGFADFLGPYGAGRLTPQAQALLVALLCQYDGKNNGSLKLAATVLSFIWRSSDRRTKAKRELLDYGFIFELKRGYQRSSGANRNVASLYAVACYPLDHNPQHDPELVALFDQNAWRDRVAAMPYSAQAGTDPSATSGIADEKSQCRIRHSADFSMPNTALEPSLLCRIRHSSQRGSMPRACHLVDVYPSISGVRAVTTKRRLH
jgi:hypothetical protein